MINFILGLTLLLIPFILLDTFSEKKKGFIYILFFSFIFHSILGLLTQYFGLFYYPVIISSVILIDVIIILVYLKKKVFVGNKLEFNWLSKIRKINWTILVVMAISIMCLFQIHYNYTGKANLVTDGALVYHEVSNMRYVYPYFSDEWYTISLIDYSTSNHTLPIKSSIGYALNPNLEIFFHSFIGEMVLVLGIDPLTQYTLLSIFFNTLIIFLIYLLLRINNISQLISGICSLFLLYIVSGANLPGLWNLLPFNLGIIFSIISFCFLSLNNIKLSLLSSIVTVLFYPPLAIFSFIGFLAFLTEYLMKKGKKIALVFYYCLAIVLSGVILFFVARLIPVLSQFIDFSFSKIFFVTLIAPYIPRLNFYEIMPFPIVILSFVGLYTIYKRSKWLFAEFILGIIMWFIYSSTTGRFFIEYERVAVFTSILAVIISGYGLKLIEEFLILRFKGNTNKILKFTEIFILIIFIYLIPSYTQGERWNKAVATDFSKGATVFPRAPANNYLTLEDIKNFNNIRGERFLSLPWKGLVIGVATGNYPIVAKEGTIMVGNVEVINQFLGFDCAGKLSMAKKYDLDYIYLNTFNCDGFERLGESGEGLVLYKVN